MTSDFHFENYDYDLCLRRDESGLKRNYLLLGDSHSAMMWSALSRGLPNANVMQASTFDCAPLLHSQTHPDCEKMMAYIFKTYLPTHSIQGLFLIARWREKDFPELTRTVAWTKKYDIPVTIFGPVPEYDGPLPRLLAYSIAWNKPDFAKEHRVNTIGMLDAKMQAMARDVWQVRYVSLYSEICGKDDCVEYADVNRRIPMMDDDNHLNEFGANFVVRRLVADGKLQ